jgi:integrase
MKSGARFILMRLRMRSDASSSNLEKQGLPHRTLHDLRHTAGTFMLASGMDVNTVQVLLGHSTPVTTLSVYGDVL